MKKFVFTLFGILLILSLLSSCRPPELEGAYVDFNAGRFDSAMKNALKATQLYPQNPEAWYMLGRLYGKKDQFKKMIDAFGASLKLSKQFADKIRIEKKYYFQTTFISGVTSYNTFLKMKDHKSEKALKVLQRALTHFQNADIIKQDYQASNLVARCYALLGKKDDSLEKYKEMTKTYPDSVGPWLELGKTYFISGDAKDAVIYLAKVLEKDPNNVEGVSFISQAYDKLGDTKNAIKAYEKAKKVNPKEMAFPFNLGLIYNKLANQENLDEKTKNMYLQKLLENFKLVLAIDPESKVGYQMKSYAEIQLKKYADAVKTIKTALEHFPDEGSLWFNLGVAYTQMNNAKEGKKAFDKAKALGYK